MILLTNNTKSTSIIGKLVSLDGTNPNAFVYTIPNASRAIGIVTESVPYRSKCKIATIGDTAKVLVQGNVLKDDVIRGAKSGDNVSLGTCKIAKSGDAPYLKIGTALTSGNGLIDTVLELTLMGSNTGTTISSGITIPSAFPYTVLATDILIVCDSVADVVVNIPSATGTGREIQIANINTGDVTVTPSGADTINGEVSQIIYEDSCMDIKDYVATKWVII